MANEIRNAAFLSTFYSHDSIPEKSFPSKANIRAQFSTDCLHQAPKWPVECQVLPEKIRHIDYTPEKPEPFYFSKNTEPQPKPVGEEMGTVIYDYQPKLSVDYFCRSCVGGSEDLQIYESDPNTLKFESRFESGNLAKVIKVTNVYYGLYLRPDMYTDRYSQWYYFRIQNTKENVLYRFSIVNLNKPDSLYRYGLKPLIYSEKSAQLHGIGWFRGGKNISYYKNDITTDDYNSSYTLTFNLKFRFDNDTVFIAQCYPYTYTKLQNYLRDVELDPFKSSLCQKRLLCKSLAGNNVYVLTITSPGEDEDDVNVVKRPVIVITARVHPGETPSSYMMAGIIDFITSNCSAARELRERFIFKLIPMLNPDGVIVGNSRCCLLGQDLNRQYRTVLREAFPQIYHTKVLLRRLAEENGIFLYCDIHGHSRRNNVFMYGCENRRIPERRLSEQVFPLMMHKNAADKSVVRGRRYFSFQGCKFKIQKSKEGTGRIFVWTLGVANSYTLEISLGGSTLASRQYTHFNMADYEGLGRHFCETLMDYSDLSPAKEKIREKILKKLMDGGSTAEEPVNVPITDYSSLSHSESDDSSGAISADENDPNPKSPLKRQTSFRHSKNTQNRIRATKPERTALSLTKASVDFLKVNTTNQTQTMCLDDLASEDSLEVETRKRRVNFGRSRSRGINQTLLDPSATIASRALSPKKYTNLLFDDPFNPPFLRSPVKGDENTDFGALSQTEDECDQTDSDFRNEKFLSNAAATKSSDVLVKEMSQLKLSLHTKKLVVPEIDIKMAAKGKMTAVALASPSSSSVSASDQPVKKIPFSSERRRSLGGKPKLLKVLKPKLSKSQEDVSSTSSTITATMTCSNPSSTRASKPKIQQSLSLAVPKLNPLTQGRRVSWTGGIIPSEPTSIAIAAGPSIKVQGPTPLPSKKKSLRKSKSLGDQKLASGGKDAFSFYGGAAGATASSSSGNDQVTNSSTQTKRDKKSSSRMKRVRSKNRLS